MHPARLMIVGLLALLGLVGCQAPGAVAPIAAEQRVTARLDWGYKLQAVVSAYTKADVDHVKMSLYTKSGASWVATGAT